jgi:recombination protein RecR
VRPAGAWRFPPVSWECRVNLIDFVIQELSRLPGLGRKSASRITYHLLKADQARVETLIQAIGNLKKNIALCSVCGNYAEADPCGICRDASRDQSLICVVEEAKDIPTLEATREFKGLYHVLGGVISPLHGVNPDNLRIGQLLERIRRQPVREVIIATNPTMEGDTTALYLGQILREKQVSVSRIALGLPVGGDLEYADRLTLSQALRGRTKL